MPTEIINSRTVIERRSLIASEPYEIAWESNAHSYVNAARTGFLRGSMAVRPPGGLLVSSNNKTEGSFDQPKGRDGTDGVSGNAFAP